ncbi:MAG: sodium:alanine symporter family protein [Deferribacterota bacterium]|nr:sodium:alanine symporter family protein [Deferribacterota bacterium]
MNINLIISKISNFVWGPVLLILLIGTGIWMSYQLRFIQIRLLPAALKLVFSGRKSKGEGNITPFQALATELAGTIGTGNIAGVATAIASGGPGAIFWMWVSAFFGMATKFSESLLALNYREKTIYGIYSGGPMYYISKGLGLKWLGVLFAIFGIIASFGIGCMVQSHSLSIALKDAFHVNVWISGIILMFLVGFVIIGGIRRIALVTERIVPFMALIYFVSALIIILVNFEKILDIIQLIVVSAFNPTAAIGGFAGASVKEAIRFGVARGVFSNEAGLGSTPIAHAAAITDNPVKQGLVSMTGVFFDTIIICSMTAFCILLTDSWHSGLSTTELTNLSFESVFGPIGPSIVSVSLILFAYSTILGWSFYGSQCVRFLAGEPIVRIYRYIFCLAVLFGALRKTELVWALSDIFNGLMAFPNLIGILGLSFVVRKIYRENIDRI